MRNSVSRKPLKSKEEFAEELTLTGFEAPLRLVNHIDAPFAPDDAAVFMPGFQRLKGAADFHDIGLQFAVSGGNNQTHGSCQQQKSLIFGKSGQSEGP